MNTKYILLVLLMTISTITKGQKKNKYEVGLSTLFSNKNNVPFWLHANKNGLMPNKNFLMCDFSVSTEMNDNKQTDMMYKINAVVFKSDKSKFVIDNLYAGFKWKIFKLFLGQKADRSVFDGLSSTNGNILYSNNARSYPRYELSVPEWTNVPFSKGVISFKGMISDGITMDNRYIDNALIHRKNLFVRLFKDYKFSISGGIEHVGMWSGNHPEKGKIPTSLNKYWKMLTGSGDKDGAFSNDSYRLGNNIGSYHFDIYYNSENFKLQAYYRSIFEDGSGRKSENRPDGLYGLYFSNNKNNKAFIKSALVEFYHTTDQSGRFRGDRNGKHYRGNDNYFNHGEYRSGWTHYGKTFGSPLFISGRNIHSVIINNRFKALHFGIKGFILNIPYKTYFTFSKNYGTNYYPFNFKHGYLSQFSALMETTLPIEKLPFKIDVACAIDYGDMLKNNIGVFAKISKQF